MTYPANIPTLPSVTDNVDYPKASDINTLSQNLAGVMNALDTNFGGATPATGDILYRSAGGEWTRLAVGTAGQALVVNSGATAPEWGAAAAATKGRGEILSVNPPATLGAPVGVIAGGSTPAENYMYFTFADAAIAYVDLKCRLIGYQGGGLTVNFEVLRTSASAGNAYVFEAAIRRINTGTEDITASHSYAYNAVTVTVPAGPPAAGIPMAGVITFTDGADMDSLADNEMFVLRFRRDPTNGSDNAGDTARVLASITIRET